MTDGSRPVNWLDEQFKKARADTEAWPEWKKRLAGFADHRWAVREMPNGDWVVIPPSGEPIERGCFRRGAHWGFTHDDALCIARFGFHLSARHKGVFSDCAECRADNRVPIYNSKGEPWTPTLEEIMREDND